MKANNKYGIDREYWKARSTEYKRYYSAHLGRRIRTGNYASKALAWRNWKAAKLGIDPINVMLPEAWKDYRGTK